jgi:hypothetical protein
MPQNTSLLHVLSLSNAANYSSFWNPGPQAAITGCSWSWFGGRWQRHGAHRSSDPPPATLGRRFFPPAVELLASDEVLRAIRMLARCTLLDTASPTSHLKTPRTRLSLKCLHPKCMHIVNARGWRGTRTTLRCHERGCRWLRTTVAAIKPLTSHVTAATAGHKMPLLDLGAAAPNEAVNNDATGGQYRGPSPSRSEQEGRNHGLLLVRRTTTAKEHDWKCGSQAWP